MVRRSLIVLVMLVLVPAIYLSLPRPTPTHSRHDIFTLEHCGDGKLKLVFKNAPPYVHALDPAPLEREKFLNRGTWLLLTYGISSVPDVSCVPVALNVAKRLRERGFDISLGVRPFHTYEPGRDNYGSPVWIILNSGKIVSWETRPFTEAELLAWAGPIFQVCKTGVSKATYEKLREGMTEREVENILGCKAGDYSAGELIAEVSKRDRARFRLINDRDLARALPFMFRMEFDPSFETRPGHTLEAKEWVTNRAIFKVLFVDGKVSRRDFMAVKLRFTE